MKHLSILLTVLLCILMIGCKSENHNFENTNPTPSNLPVLALTPSSTPTHLSSSTPAPALTPTPILSVVLPQWVANPDSQILLVPTGTFKDGFKNLTLVNARTSERFDLPQIIGSGDYFWMPDGSQFGFLPRDANRITLVSNTDGNITTTLISDNAVKFLVDRGLGGPPYSIQATTSNVSDIIFFLLQSWMTLSPDKKYFVYEENYDPTYTSVIEVSTGKTIVITDANDGYFDLFSEWSSDSRFLAVSQADQEPGMYYHFEIPPTFRLRVYDINTRQMIASYKNVTFPTWSPDGTKFLFQEWQEWFGESPPCVFDTISGATKCYNDSLIRHKRSGTIQTTFSSIQWSPDQTMIGYIYWGVDETPHDEYGGFCAITVISNTARCMLEEFELNDQKIIDYSWSPDSNFISFQYDTSCPYCDYRDNPQLAIANVKTGEYFTIGDNVNSLQLGLWRPLFHP